MSTGTVISSFIYSLFQISQGLLFHPYQTMQSLVRDKVFIWMALLPTLILALVTILWRFVIVPVVSLVFSCQATGFVGCDILPFISDWLTFFCIYWQILLLYLLFRFGYIFKPTS